MHWLFLLIGFAILVMSFLTTNTVVMVLQKGYLIADRVLRPALVTVAGPQ